MEVVVVVVVDDAGDARNCEAIDRMSLSGSVHRRVSMLRILDV